MKLKTPPIKGVKPELLQIYQEFMTLMRIPYYGVHRLNEYDLSTVCLHIGQN